MSTATMQFDPTMVILTSLQAVTVSLVAYLVYSNSLLQNNNSSKKDVVTTKEVAKPAKEDDTTEESDSSVKEVEVHNEKRSVRGVNVYGPYKKVSLFVDVQES